MKIELNKQYKTRDGREVRIYAVDGTGPHHVHGSIKTKYGWAFTWWNEDGKTCNWRYNLIEVKPRIKQKGWVNVYRGREREWTTLHDDRSDADDFHCDQRIACVEVDIDVEEGHGL